MVEGEHAVPSPDGGSDTIICVKQATVVAQPQGALANAGLDKVEDDSIALVLDMGGGTFDWLLRYGRHGSRSHSGTTPIGMLACATAVCDRIGLDLRNDPHIMAKVDAALRAESRTVRIAGRDVELAVHLPVVSAILRQALDQMQATVGSMLSVDSTLVTGGGAKLLAKEFKRHLPDYERIVSVDRDPVMSNVRGFQILAESLNSRRESAPAQSSA